MSDPIPPLTDDEIDTLALQAVRGEVFFGLTEEDIRCSFMLILSAWCAEHELPPNVGLVYEEMSKRVSDRGINGRPFFGSMKWVAEESVEPLFDKIRAKLAAMESA
jgi:hypothetical protein